MKTLKYILLGVILSSLVFSGFSQSGEVTFCETYTRQELISILDPEDNFFNLVQMAKNGSKIGTCSEVDLDQLWKYIQSDSFRSKVPEELIIAPGAEPGHQVISLYAIKKSSPNNRFPSQQDIAEVNVRKDDQKDNYALFLSFSESGAELWSSMTRLNKGRSIAILVDGKVISAPMVREEIKDGKCVISGKFTKSEITALKAVLEN